MGVYLYSRLPSAYQEVEYIQSSGTQYIDTGYVPNNNTKVSLSMGGWNEFQQHETLFGARYNWSQTGRGFVLGYNTQYMYYAMFDYALDISTSSLNFINGNDHIIEMSQSGVYEDGSLKQSLNTKTFTSPVNLTLFAMNDNGTVKEQGAYKMYYCKLYESGTLIRDFVPCYRISDGVVGLYDLVNSTFYTNSGSGSFTKGADVNTEHSLKNAYIGEPRSYTPTVNTVAYYPLSSISTVNDKSGNSKNMTQSGTITYGDYNGVDCGYFNGGYLYLNESLILGANPRTISCWFNRTSAVADGGAFWGMGNASSENGITTYLHGNAPATGKYGYGNWATNRDVGFSVSPSLNTWYLLTATYDGTDLLLYVNANYLGTPTIGEYSGTNTITLNLTSGKTTICCMPNLGGTGFKGYMSEFIFENKTWVADYIANYYNTLKGNYGIS